jgi:hypothetical protein
MTKPELKEMIRKLLVEILTEDFIQKSVNEIVRNKITIEVSAPSFKIGKQKLEEDVEDDGPTIPQKKSLVEYKSKLSAEDRKRLHQKIQSDDGDVLDKSKIAQFDNPAMRALAEDTFQHQAEKAAEVGDPGFTKEELAVLDVNKSLRILDAADKK